MVYQRMRPPFLRLPIPIYGYLCIKSNHSVKSIICVSLYFQTLFCPTDLCVCLHANGTCLDYCSITVSRGVQYYNPSNFVLLMLVNYSSPLYLHRSFRLSLYKDIAQQLFWDFNGACIKHMQHLRRVSSLVTRSSAYLSIH